MLVKFLAPRESGSDGSRGTRACRIACLCPADRHVIVGIILRFSVAMAQKQIPII